MQMQDNTTQTDQQCIQLFFEPYHGQGSIYEASTQTQTRH